MQPKWGLKHKKKIFFNSQVVADFLVKIDNLKFAISKKWKFWLKTGNFGQKSKVGQNSTNSWKIKLFVKI